MGTFKIIYNNYLLTGSKVPLYSPRWTRWTRSFVARDIIVREIIKVNKATFSRSIPNFIFILSHFTFQWRYIKLTAVYKVNFIVRRAIVQRTMYWLTHECECNMVYIFRDFSYCTSGKRECNKKLRKIWHIARTVIF